MMNFLKGTLHSVELIALATIGIAIGSIPLGIGLVAVAFIPASKLLDDIQGNEIKNSIFSVSRDGKINQNSLGKPLRFISLLSGKDKQKQFTDEALNMFVELDATDKKGCKKNYHTKSQILTLTLLKKLEKNGYIENLEYKEAEKSRLIVERLLFGNFKDVLKSKKHKMYNISFNLTDKERNKEDLMILAGIKPNPVVNSGVSNSTVVTKEEPVSVKKTKKEELIEMKAELLAAKSVHPIETDKERTAKK